MNLEAYRKYIHPTVVVLSLGAIGWLGYQICYPNGIQQKKVAAKKAKLAPPAGEVQPEPSIDQTHAQPATGRIVGTGLEYKTATPAPSASASAPARDEEAQTVEYTSAPLVLCDITPTPTPAPTPKPAVEEVTYWLPRGTYIPFVTQMALLSSHMSTPFEAVVTEDVYNWIDGMPYKIISAGDRLLSFATPGYIRDKVEVKGRWSLIFVHTGKEVEFDGIACDQEYNPANNRYDANEEKSAGLKGKFIQSDRIALFRNLMGFLLTTTANTAVNAGGAVAGTLLEQGTNGSVQSFNTGGAAPFIDKYVGHMINPNQISDTLYVQVPAGKPGYVLNTSVIEPQLASMGAKRQRDEARREAGPPLSIPEQLQNLQVKNVSKALEETKETKKDEATDTDAALK